MDNVSMARSTSRMFMFPQQEYRPFEDYLGLSALVKNLNLNLTTDDTSTIQYGTTRSSSTSSAEHNANDFHLNGIDVDMEDNNEGFQPFQPVSRNVSRLPLMNRLKRTPTYIGVYFAKIIRSPRWFMVVISWRTPKGEQLAQILRNYTCPICGVSGDGAHTIKYCPLNKEETSIDTTSANLLKAPGTTTSTRKKSELLLEPVPIKYQNLMLP